jgi:hypothetical protein
MACQHAVCEPSYATYDPAPAVQHIRIVESFSLTIVVELELA